MGGLWKQSSNSSKVSIIVHSKILIGVKIRQDRSRNLCTPIENLLWYKLLPPINHFSGQMLETTERQPKNLVYYLFLMKHNNLI